jgi:hypothetical protein
MLEDHPLTRRRLLVVGGAAAATAMLPEVAFAGGTNVTKDNWFERGTYTGKVGDAFRMATGGGTLTLRLRAVLDLEGKDARGRSLAGRNDAFVLSFTAPAGSPSFHDTRLFTHATLGQHPLFVVGGSGAGGAFGYEVLVNRSFQ